MEHESAHQRHALNREAILEALARLDRKLGDEGTVGEICIFGGSAMVLAFNARLSTKDVDAIFKPPEIFRRAAMEIAEEMGLPPTWLNDGVKGFVSSRPQYAAAGLNSLAHLRVIYPAVEYLLAMKCMAARAPGYDTQGDRDDITFLISQLGLETSEDVLRVVEQFYPADRILPKTHFMILEILENMPSKSVPPSDLISHLPTPPPNPCPGPSRED